MRPAVSPQVKEMIEVRCDDPTMSYRYSMSIWSQLPRRFSREGHRTPYLVPFWITVTWFPPYMKVKVELFVVNIILFLFGLILRYDLPYMQQKFCKKNPCVIFKHWIKLLNILSKNCYCLSRNVYITCIILFYASPYYVLNIIMNLFRWIEDMGVHLGFTSVPGRF